MSGATEPARTPLLVQRAIVWALALALLCLGQAAAADGPTVRQLDVDGTITPVMANYIRRGIHDAERARDAAVVLRMDTPGGLSSAMDDIVKDILASKVPVVVYVAPSGARAASAGVYITYAAHVAAMAPSTNIGSATPIFLDQNGQPTSGDQALENKVVNDAVAKIRGLASLRGRNADWAEKAVREAVNVTAQEAADQHIVDLVAPDLPALLRAIDGRTVQVDGGPVTLHTAGATVRTDGMSLSEQFLQLISDPSVAYIMLSLGMLGLFFELASPGAILPGVLGGILLLLGLFSLGSLNVNWAGILLMAFAFLLFVADVYLPSHGALTVGGIVAFALGSFILMNSTSNPLLHISRLVVVTVTALIGGFFLFAVSAVVRARLRRTRTGREGLLGAVGTVRQRLDPAGYIFVNGELWRATSLVGAVEPGTEVEVVGIDGLTLTVLPVGADQKLLPAQSG